MDINLDYSDDENPITLKSDFILSLCDLIIGGKEGLSPIERTIIDRCTRLYLSKLAHQGFVVCSVEYRTSNEGCYPIQIEDVKAAIRYLKAHADRYRIDKEHFGAMGESAGGFLTCMAALDHDKARDVGEYLEESSSIQAACPWYPPTNLSTFKHKDAEECAASMESLLLGYNIMLW